MGLVYNIASVQVIQIVKMGVSPDIIPTEIDKNFPEQAKSSRRGEGNTEIMEMLRSIKKDMEEKEHKWENQQQIREEFLEAEFRRKEQLL